MKTLLLLALVGCSGSKATGFEVDGFVSGNAPQSGTVIAVWDTSGTTYKWGDGTSSTTSFTATLDFTPPPGIEYGTSGVAVGNLVLVPDGTMVADGTIDLATVSYLGISTGYSIIYKDALATGLGLTWDESFGGGYSCAKCITPITGKDIYQLTPCANVTIDVGSTRTCSWK